MHATRKTPWRRAAALIIATALPGVALAQTACNPLRIVVPFSAGSGADLLGRVYAQRLGAQMKQSVIVENKEGAGGMIGAAHVVSLPADGCTLLVATTPFVVGPISQQSSLYRPIEDFTAVGRVAINPLALAVNASVPGRTLLEFVAYAKANPAKLTYASSGPGTPSQLDMENLKAQLGVDIREIPYKSNAQALQDVVGGTVSMYYTVQSTTLSNIRAGKLKALGVGAARPTKALPEVPTIASAANLPGYEALIWYGFVARAGTPREAIDRLAKEVAAASQTTEVIEGVEKGGFEIAPSTPAEFASQMHKEAQKWSALAKAPK